MKLQIHIGGTKRSGKTTLAELIQRDLKSREMNPVVFDIDEVRRDLFGPADTAAPIGSEANRVFHASAHWYILKALIPNAFRAGQTPIMVATHANRRYYEAARETAEGEGATLKFVLLETPTVEEAARRSRADTTSLSDTRDLEGDPTQMEAYLVSTLAFIESYREQQGNYFWIPQSSPDEMAALALHYILTEVSN